MAYSDDILNGLLDKYERSGHCLPGKESSRPVSLSMLKGDCPPYRENNPVNRTMNQVVQQLADQGLVSFTWKKGYKNWLLEKVSLNLDHLEEAYAAVGRTPLAESARRLRQLLQDVLPSLQTPWKQAFLQSELDHLDATLKPTRLLSCPLDQAQAILKVLQYTEQGADLMRVISVNCFQDSKYLERNIKGSLASIAKAWDPELAEYHGEDEDTLPQSAVLAELGVLTYPEIFEFCGKLHLELGGTWVDAAPFQRGFCLQSDNLPSLTRMDLSQIRCVLFVENRTNYRALLLRGIPQDCLVVFHGGFYSPRRGRFFRIIAESLPPQAQTAVFFWGDLDTGGFLMFSRLKKNLFPALSPYRMGPEDYLHYSALGTRRPAAYLEALRQKADSGALDPVFLPVVRKILKKKTTVEQEIML